MSLFLPNQNIPDSFSQTMLKLGMVTEEEAKKLAIEDGFLVENAGSEGAQITEGKGGKNSCKGKKDNMKSSCKSPMKDNMKDKEEAEESDLDADSFFEDDEDASAETFFEGDDEDDDDEKDEKDCDESFDEDGELSEEELEIEEAFVEKFELAQQVVEAFESLDEDEVGNLTLENLATIMDAQATIINAYEEACEAVLDDEGDLTFDEAFGSRVKKRVTGAGRRKARVLRRGGAKSKAKRSREKTTRRTKHMSPMQKVKFLAKKNNTSTLNIMTGRAASRSRRSGKAEKVRRLGRLQDYSEDKDVETKAEGGDLFATLGRIRAMANQPVEAISQEDLSNQIHAAYDTVESMASVVAERMKADIGESDVEEGDHRLAAMNLFTAIAEGAKKHHEEMEGGEYTIERAVTNLETLVGDLVRGKEQCKAIK